MVLLHRLISTARINFWFPSLKKLEHGYQMTANAN